MHAPALKRREALHLQGSQTLWVTQDSSLKRWSVLLAAVLGKENHFPQLYPC